MKIGIAVNMADFLNKVTDSSDDVNEGVAQLYYPVLDKAKVSDLPIAPNAYLEIEKVAVAPDPVGDEGSMYFNTTESKFYVSDGSAYIECLFVIQPVGA